MSANGDDVYVSGESEDSDSSFHSLGAQVENLNIGEADFISPDFATKTSASNGHVEDSSLDNHNNASDSSNHEDEAKDPDDVYFIDKEYLKDLESTYSPEDREANHQKALENKDSGNESYKNKLFESAALDYTSGLRICPLDFDKTRSILYANRAAARSQFPEPDLKACKLDCTESLELQPSYLKAIIRRANLNKRLEDLDEALADYKKVLEMDPYNVEAKEAVTVLPPLIEEKNEKLKEEMMGKLKDIGNMILKPFGISTDNFAMNQDPKSGGYNIQFNQS